MAMVCNDITRREAILDIPLRILLQWVTIRLEEQEAFPRMIAAMFASDEE